MTRSTHPRSSSSSAPRTVLSALALAGALATGAGAAHAANIPVTKPLDPDEQYLVGVDLQRDRPETQQVLDYFNSLLDVPRIGQLGDFGADAGMYDKYRFWILPSQMGVSSTAGAWADFNSNILGRSFAEHFGHRIKAQAWLYSNPYFDPTMICTFPGCSNSPWRAEAFVEHVVEHRQPDGQIVDGPVTRLTDPLVKPASLETDIHADKSVQVLHQNYDVDLGVFGDFHVSIDADLGINATGKLSVSPDGAIATVDATGKAGLHMYGYGNKYVCEGWWIFRTCTSGNAVTWANVLVMDDYMADRNGDGRIDPQDAVGFEWAPAARVHTRVAVGERRLNLDDLAHPYNELCASAEGNVWLERALTAYFTYAVDVKQDGKVLEGSNKGFSAGPVPRLFKAAETGECAPLAYFF